MHSTTRYSFRAATMRDLPVLQTWQSQPHVRAWWDDGAPYDQDQLNDPRVARWIVQHKGAAFAYMQDYSVHGWATHHFAHLPQGSRGIDQYIGDPEMVGLGHGTAFIAARLKNLFDAGAPVIATDPHPDNARAIAAYQKVGFTVAAPPQDTEWGLILPMTLNAAQRGSSQNRAAP